MPQPLQLARALCDELPETYRLLAAANLTLHPAVTRVVLSGSRGPAGGARADSDIDLTLLVDTGGLPIGPALAGLLEDVLATTLDHWRGAVEADLAAVFDTRGCGLACFAERDYHDGACAYGGGVDCFGIYKVQKGFRGFVPPIGVEVARVHPCLVIWQRGAQLEQMRCPAGPEEQP